MNSSKNFDRLWAGGVVPSCPVPGPGVTQGRKNIELGCEGLIKKVTGGVGSGLVCLHIKGVSSHKLFVITKN